MAAVVVLAIGATPAAARTVDFDGQAVDVPAGWPVYRLAEHPRMCVRLDRRAVYLGTPGAGQRCPSHAIGRRRAILVDPGARARARAQASAGVGIPASGTAGAEDFTGLGFDACAAPSSRAMAAWATSPYRAIGVYIGGANRACSQPNLTDDLGGRTGRGRLAPDPDLRRPAGADQRLRQLRQAQREQSDAHRGPKRPATRSPKRRASAWGRAARSTSTWRPTRGRRAPPGDPCLPLRLDRPAPLARLHVRRLQLQRLGHRRPRPRDRRAPTRCPTTSGPRTGTAPGTPSTRTSRAAPGPRTSASTSTAAATTRPTA